MANNNYDTTPGSAVADTLQNILARKRAESRQQLMDQIQMANMGSEMNYRSAQAEGLKDYHEARADELKALAQKRSEEATHRQKVMDFLDNMLTNLPKDADPNVVKQLQLARATGDTTSINDIIKNLKPTKAQGGFIWTMDKNGNPYNTGKQMGAGDTFHYEPKIQFPPQPHQPSLVFGKDKKTGQQLVFEADPVNHKFIPYQMPTGDIDFEGRTIPKESPDKFGKVTPQTKSAYLTLRQSWLKDPSNANVNDMFTKAGQQFINEYGASPDVTSVVSNAWGNPKARTLTPEQFQQKLSDAEKASPGTFDPNAVNQAVAMWRMLNTDPSTEQQ